MSFLHHPFLLRLRSKIHGITPKPKKISDFNFYGTPGYWGFSELFICICIKQTSLACVVQKKEHRKKRNMNKIKHILYLNGNST